MTQHWNNHTDLCITCKKFLENRIHFVQCTSHKEILTTLTKEMKLCGLAEDFPEDLPYLFNDKQDINTSNVPIEIFRNNTNRRFN